MREFARSFYTSKAWKTTSKAYMQSKNYICERCGGVAAICHHKKYLTPNNINDPNIALSWDNLEALCHNCHDLEHMQKYNKTYFAEDGTIEKVKEGREIKEFKTAKDDLDRLMSNIYDLKPV